LADVFKGAGEDAGEFALTLHKVGTEFEDVTAEQQAYIDATVGLLVATENTERELVKLASNTQGLGTALSTFWENIKTGTVGTLNDLINAFQTTEEQIESFRKSVAGGDKESIQGAIDELNEELIKAEKLLKFHESQTRKNVVVINSWKDEVEKLNIQISDAETKLKELTDAEIAAEKAAKLLAKQQKEDSELTIKNAKAKDEAVKSSKALEKSLENEAKARKKNIETLINENESFATRQRVLGEAEGENISEKEIDDITKATDEKIKQRARESNAKKAADQRDFNDAEEAAELKRELIEDIANTTLEITAGFANLRIQQISQELTALEFARNRELELAKGNATKEAAINAKFDAQKRELQKKQANTEKANALFSIAVNTALSISKTAGQLGFPAAIPFIVVAAAAGLAQAAFVLAQKPPEFAEGVLNLKGKGSGTSDSIHAMLSKGETVVTAQNTNDYYPTLKAIHNNEISPDVLNQMVLNGGSQPNITVNDYDKLAKALLDRPEKNVVMDENGFTGHIVRKAQYLRLKQSKYKM
jgi:hypothetical protein